MENLLSGKTLLITGGTSELGLALVGAALRSGAKVFFTYYRAREKARALETLGAEGFQSDFSSQTSMDSFLESFRKKTEKLDTLIHNAAAVRDGLLLDMSEEDWDYVLAVNLRAPFYLTRGLLPLLFRANPAKVFMLTSRMAYLGAAAASNYAVSKAGVIGLVKSLAKELGKKRVLVNAVNPGFMMSGMTQELSAKLKEKHLEASPLKVFSDPEEVAGFMMDLASDKMKQVTGQVFHFDSRNTPWG